MALFYMSINDLDHVFRDPPTAKKKIQSRFFFLSGFLPVFTSFALFFSYPTSGSPSSNSRLCEMFTFSTLRDQCQIPVQICTVPGSSTEAKKPVAKHSIYPAMRSKTTGNSGENRAQASGVTWSEQTFSPCDSRI